MWLYNLLPVLLLSWSVVSHFNQPQSLPHKFLAPNRINIRLQLTRVSPLYPRVLAWICTALASPARCQPHYQMYSPLRLGREPSGVLTYWRRWRRLSSVAKLSVGQLRGAAWYWECHSQYRLLPIGPQNQRPRFAKTEGSSCTNPNAERETIMRGAYGNLFLWMIFNSNHWLMFHQCLRWQGTDTR
jgi:hypothetical protein